MTNFSLKHRINANVCHTCHFGWLFLPFLWIYIFISLFFINFCHFFCQFSSIVSLYARYFASVTQYFSSTLFTKSSVIIKIAFDSQTIYLWSRIISDHINIRFIPPTILQYIRMLHNEQKVPLFVCVSVSSFTDCIVRIYTITFNCLAIDSKCRL